jgi:NADP-dependent alcohol dehydrogenase
MNNFEFHAPTKIVFGQGQIARLTDLIPEKAKVLLTYGQGSIKNNGVYDTVLLALAQYEVFEFGGITPNPDYDYLLQALPLIQSHNIDFILSVGGGSVVDGTKFIAAAACYQGDPWEIIKSGGGAITHALPHGAVLTLPATGTEMNRWSVVSRRSIKAKRDFGHPALYLQFAILDPSSTFSLPRKQIVNGIVDAFTHVMEQYITYIIDAPLQDRLAEAVLVTLIEEGQRVLAEPNNYDARANFMWAATMALNGLIEAGMTSDWTTHKIGHELTALYGLDHGETLAIVLPATMQVLRASKHEKLVQYARNVWKLNIADEQALIEAAITATKDFFIKIGAKIYLRDYGIGRDDFTYIADTIGDHGVLPLGERKNVGKKEIIKILETCYS